MKPSYRKWNQGDVTLNDFDMQRERAALTVPVSLPADELFRRACGAARPAWMPDGAMQLRRSTSGRDEPEAMWREETTGPALLGQPGLAAHWMTTVLDRASRRYQAVIAWPGLALATLDLAADPLEQGAQARLELTVTPLSRAGSEACDGGLPARMAALLQRFGEALRHAPPAPSPAPRLEPVTLAGRVAVAHEEVVTGDLDTCFELACPVAELKWIEDWCFDLVYSDSGVNEPGCVFMEPFTGLAVLRAPRAHNHWYTTHYRRQTGRFEAVWVTEALTMARWQVRMTELEPGQVRINWQLSYGDLGDAGAALMAEPGMERRMADALRFISASLKHFVERGTLYRLSVHRKLRIAAGVVGAAIGRHLHG